MIRDRDLWNRFEDEQAARDDLSIEARFALLDAMYEEARLLGVFPPVDPLEGIEVDIRVARVLNVRSAHGTTGH